MSATPSPPTMTSTATVLLVEDCQSDRTLLQMRCRNQGLSVNWQITGSCAETEVLLQRIDCGLIAKPGLAIIDQRLPDGDGAALIDRLAARLPGTRLLLYSCLPPVIPDDLAESMTVDRLVKPREYAGYDVILDIIRQTATRFEPS